MSFIAEKPILEEALVTVRQGGEGTSFIDPELSAELRRVFTLWRRLKAAEAEFSEAKENIARRAAAFPGLLATVSFETGGITCTVTNSHEALVPEENVAEFRNLLGRRFRDLVRTNIRRTATSRLLSEAGEDVLGLLTLRRLNPQFKWGVSDSLRIKP